MEFGQNRVQYDNFNWKKISQENTEILYYGTEEKLATEALLIARSELNRLEKYLAYKYGGSMQIMLFRNLTDYRQSNVGYSNPRSNSGGYFWIPDDLGAVYFNGDYHYLKQQISRAVCDIILREMIFGGSLQDRFEKVRTSALPEWFIKGLPVILSEGWSADFETRMREAMENGEFRNFNTLDKDQSVLAGAAIWRYLLDKYGPDAISTIVFIARYTHSAEAAIYFHTKKTLAEFLSDWRDYYQKDFQSDLSAYLPRGKSNIPARITGKKNTEFALSPDGSKVVIVTNDHGAYRIWEYNLNQRTTHHLFAGGAKVLNQITDFQFPKIAWNEKTGHPVALTDEKGRYKLRDLYQPASAYENVSLEKFSGITDLVIHPDQDRIYLSAISNGESDIWVYRFSTRKFEQITFDKAFDHQLAIDANGDLIFVSDRKITADSGTAYIPGNFNLFSLSGDGSIRNLTRFNAPVHISHPIGYNSTATGFLCDINGLMNAWIVLKDSGTRIFPQTHYKRSIAGQSISRSGGITAELLEYRGKYIIFTGEIPSDPLAETVSIRNLSWLQKFRNPDSLFLHRNSGNIPEGGNISDSVKRSKIDSATHTDYLFQTGFPNIAFGSDKNADSAHLALPKNKGDLKNVFQPEFLLWQSDNRLLGSYAQSNRIKHEALRNPWLMPFFKVTLSDLLKNYALEAGVRTSLDLYNTDFVTRFSIFKYRFDHDFSISRHSRKYEETSNRLMHNLSVQCNYALIYPFGSNARISLQTGIRRELLSTKGSEKMLLNIPDQNDFYFTPRIEYNYDNTTSLGLNRQTGLRAKAGLENIFPLFTNRQPIYNLWADVRHYLPIGKKLIWANRLAGSYALGKGKTAFYMGGVENWTEKVQFPKNQPWLNGNEYLMQQWICNLRGFNRGVRIGSSYLLLNSELRLPVFILIKRKPIESEFIKNFTLTGFADAGTAFIGKSTADPDNPFNTVQYAYPNYTLSVTSRRNPWVAGIGWGLRTRILGYFVKFDRAIGYADASWGKAINYLSLGFDF